MILPISNGDGRPKLIRGGRWLGVLIVAGSLFWAAQIVISPPKDNQGEAIRPERTYHREDGGQEKKEGGEIIGEYIAENMAWVVLGLFAGGFLIYSDRFKRPAADQSLETSYLVRYPAVLRPVALLLLVFSLAAWGFSIRAFLLTQSIFMPNIAFGFVLLMLPAALILLRQQRLVIRMDENRILLPHGGRTITLIKKETRIHAVLSESFVVRDGADRRYSIHLGMDNARRLLAELRANR